MTDKPDNNAAPPPPKTKVTLPIFGLIGGALGLVKSRAKDLFFAALIPFAVTYAANRVTLSLVVDSMDTSGAAERLAAEGSSGLILAMDVLALMAMVSFTVACFRIVLAPEGQSRIWPGVGLREAKFFGASILVVLSIAPVFLLGGVVSNAAGTMMGQGVGALVFMSFVIGLVLAIKFSVALPLIAVKPEARIIPALKWSWAVTKGVVPHIFLASILMALLTTFVTMLLSGMVMSPFVDPSELSAPDALVEFLASSPEILAPSVVVNFVLLATFTCLQAEIFNRLAAAYSKS